MASKSNPTTAMHGANVERDCIRRKVRRLRAASNANGDPSTVTVLDGLIDWIDHRSNRYHRKAGGLGNKRGGK